MAAPHVTCQKLPLLCQLRPYLLALSPWMRFCGPTARTALKSRPASHTATMQWHSLGRKAHWAFSSASSLVSFYGWRHRNSWLIWMTYPRISAWIYWYKNELNSYLKSTFPPATQRKQAILKCLFLKLNWRKAAKFSIQRYFQLIPSSISTWTIQLLGSLNRLDHFFTDRLFYLSITFFPSPAYTVSPESPPSSSPISAHPYLPLFTWQNCYHHQIWFFSDCLTTKQRENKQLHWRVLFQRYNTNLKGPSAPLNDLPTLSWPAYVTSGKVRRASTPPLDTAGDVDLHFLQTQKQTGDNRSILHRPRTLTDVYCTYLELSMLELQPE